MSARPRLMKILFCLHLSLLLFCTSVMVFINASAISAAGHNDLNTGRRSVHFTFNTEPPGAKVALSEEGSRLIFQTGLSGEIMAIDIPADFKRLAAKFEHPGYFSKTVIIDSALLQNNHCYPPSRALRLDSALRNVVFLTDPPGAEIFITLYSYPQQPQAIGISGKPVIWDLSRYGRDHRYEIQFRLSHYRDRTVALESDGFYTGRHHYYPASMQPIRLEPVIPVIIPLYYWGRNNTAASIILTLSITASMLVLICGFLVPRNRRLKKKIEQLSRWETIAARVKKADSMNGYIVGSYRLVEKIAEGGMASVYRAVPKETLDEEKSAAIKLMSEDISGDEDYCIRFKREMSITSIMDHPSILRIYDYGEQRGMLYLVMELAEGGTLKDQIPQHGLPLKRFYHLFKPVIEAIHYAHGRGIIHRDIKPENVLITGSGIVKVSDFGAAHLKHHSTVTGETLGTPSYMAPEQVTSNQTDERTDQYSLGIMAYQMLTGKLPFQDEKTVSIVYKQVRETPLPPVSIRPDLPERIDTMVMQMLEKDPEKRFPSLKEVLMELDAVFERR